MKRIDIQNLFERLKNFVFWALVSSARYIQRDYKRLLKWAGLAAILGIGGIIGFYMLVKYGYFGHIPTELELKNVKNPIASEVYAKDGKLLGRYYLENRTNASYKNLSRYLLHALVSTEDARFYKHGGIDTRSMFRVIVKSVLLGDDSSGGGSTLSQQLAKNLFGRKSYGRLSMPVNKTREMIIAQRLENVYSKDEVITLYLNTVPFGEDVFGIDMACERFFGTTPDKIKPEEAATLIGMLKAPTTYNPKNNPALSKSRRNTVLEQMDKARFISSKMADSLKKTPLTINYTLISHTDGLAPYFRAFIRPQLKQWCEQNKHINGNPYNLYTDGFKIYTTIDSKLQQYAEEALMQHMEKLQDEFKKSWANQPPWGTDKTLVENAKKNSKRYKWLKENNKTDTEINKAFNTPVRMNVFTYKGSEQRYMSPQDSIIYYLLFLNAGFVAIEPQTGEVKAWVGGINFKNFQYDHVTSTRQVGSTFKPIVYAAALEAGMEPCTYLSNNLTSYPEYNNWTPQNSEDLYGGYYSLKGALTHSLNTCTADLIMQIGIPRTIYTARRLGIEAELPEVPSIALGVSDISLFEMVQVYAALANKGTRVIPTYITHITDAKDKPLKNFRQKYNTSNQAVTPQTADYITQMLQSVVEQGTARRLRTSYKLYQDLAGKTGTTQSQADGWFVGYNPKLAFGAWVGGATPKIRFKSMSLGQGANTGLPICALFLQKVFADPKYAALSIAKFSPIPDSTNTLANCPDYIDNIVTSPDIATADDFKPEQPEPVNVNFPPPVLKQLPPDDEAPTPPDGTQKQPPKNTKQPQKKRKFGEWFRDVFR
jgi:penicillin-binding protein 1A